MMKTAVAYAFLRKAAKILLSSWIRYIQGEPGGPETVVVLAQEYADDRVKA
jgi:hypothetical protein